MNEPRLIALGRLRMLLTSKPKEKVRIPIRGITTRPRIPRIRVRR